MVLTIPIILLHVLVILILLSSINVPFLILKLFWIWMSYLFYRCLIVAVWLMMVWIRCWTRWMHLIRSWWRIALVHWAFMRIHIMVTRMIRYTLLMIRIGVWMIIWLRRIMTMIIKTLRYMWVTWHTMWTIHKLWHVLDWSIKASLLLLLKCFHVFFLYRLFCDIYLWLIYFLINFHIWFFNLIFFFFFNAQMRIWLLSNLILSLFSSLFRFSSNNYLFLFLNNIFNYFIVPHHGFILYFFEISQL